ncbi:hypothetical protein D9758_012074 [Tetrapyrgos nigripes]|uniref:CHAT domain-containing protein n=1 Tax=Tetrapyrgos nigripes TaxID=182062 RepID=A0A8H5FJ75_9AGAR|nr:hypothetical protein D9758_012074 [Tetrapyrgos nigripes]
MNADIRDDDGFTPLQWARMNGKSEMERLLRQHTGSDIKEDNWPVYMERPLESHNSTAHYEAQQSHYSCGSRFYERFLKGGSLDLLSEAIAQYKQANSLDPDGSDGLMGISKFYQCKYQHTNDQQDLDLAIEASEMEYRIRGSIQAALPLCQLLIERCEQMRPSATDLNRILEIYRVAMFGGERYLSDDILDGRFEAICAYAYFYLRFKDARSALIPLKLVISLLSEFIGPGFHLEYRYSNIAQTHRITSTAVGTAIETGEMSLALDWFEQGRCILWSQILRLRMPVDELRSDAPKLVQDMDSIFAQLSECERIIGQYPAGAPFAPGREPAVMRYSVLVNEFEGLIDQARRLPGHENFLQRKTLEDLKQVTALGAVVALHVHERSSNALILLPNHNDILHVSLPQLTLQHAERMQSDFRKVFSLGRMRGERATYWQYNDFEHMERILSYMWTSIVKPVLEATGYYTPVPPSHPPRIIWCASGLLSFLPLHAAGIYYKSCSEQPKALDYAVHSYTPSLFALLNAFQQSVKTMGRKEQPAVFAVSQPATPGAGRLPGTVSEVEAIEKALGTEKLTWLNDSTATTAALLAGIKQHSWIHLACHRVQNQENPLQSKLLLHNGSVALRSIMPRTVHRRKALTILSACQTATGSESIPEEVVHLAAGMFMIGFQSVVGTMWSIQDADVPVVMNAFYRYLVDEVHSDSTQSAYALHYAVKELREKIRQEKFLQWVPFIHFGV